ncbi:MAG: hypothetical protein AAF591_07690 [Verrucomicrobiota bacterium]
MKKLIFVANDCPSSGNTTVTEILCDFFRARSNQTALLTTDRSSPRPTDPSREFQLWELNDEEDLEVLVSKIDENDVVLVDVATGDTSELCRFFNNQELADVLPELDCELTVCVPVKMELENHDSITEIAEIIADNADYFITKSFSFGCDHEDDVWEGSYNQRVMSYLNATEVETPRIPDAVIQGLEVSGFDLSGALANQEQLEDDLATPLLRWKAKYCSQLQEEAADCLLPEHEEVHVSAYSKGAIAC